MLSLEALDPDWVHARFPLISDACRRAGFDLARDRIPIGPAAHYVMGGVVTDLDARTTVAGLYAAGEVACTGVHGANRLASNSLLEGLVFGARAGIDMRAGVRAGQPGGAGSPVSGRAGGPRPSPPSLDADAIRDVMWREVGLFRDKPGLERALGVLEPEWQALDARIRDGEPIAGEDWRAASILTVGRLIAAAALRREESRGAPPPTSKTMNVGRPRSERVGEEARPPRRKRWKKEQAMAEEQKGGKPAAAGRREDALVTEITPQSEDSRGGIRCRGRRAGRLHAGQGFLAIRPGAATEFDPALTPLQGTGRNASSRRSSRKARARSRARRGFRRGRATRGGDEIRRSARHQPTSEAIIGTMQADRVASPGPHQPVGERGPLGEGPVRSCARPSSSGRKGTAHET